MKTEKSSPKDSKNEDNTSSLDIFLILMFQISLFSFLSMGSVIITSTLYIIGIAGIFIDDDMAPYPEKYYWVYIIKKSIKYYSLVATGLVGIASKLYIFLVRKFILLALISFAAFMFYAAATFCFYIIEIIRSK